MTLELLAENEILKNHRQALLDAFNESIREIQGSQKINLDDKMDVLGILARHLNEVVKEYPIIKDIM
jgi:hypothetical protein